MRRQPIGVRIGATSSGRSSRSHRVHIAPSWRVERPRELLSAHRRTTAFPMTSSPSSLGSSRAISATCCHVTMAEVTFRADGEELVRATGRRGRPGGDHRGAAGLLRPAARLARQESRRALTEQIAARPSTRNDEDWERLEEALIAGDVGVAPRRSSCAGSRPARRCRTSARRSRRRSPTLFGRAADARPRGASVA